MLCRDSIVVAIEEGNFKFSQHRRRISCGTFVEMLWGEKSKLVSLDMQKLLICMKHVSSFPQRLFFRWSRLLCHILALAHLKRDIMEPTGELKMSIKIFWCLRFFFRGEIKSEMKMKCFRYRDFAFLFSLIVLWLRWCLEDSHNSCRGEVRNEDVT